MNAHTPTPWEQSHNVILSEAGTIVGDGFHLTPADTAHIVACVNAHDALTARVAELEAALHKLANSAERVAEGLAYIGPPGHVNYLNKTGAANRLTRDVTDARAALAKGQV